MPNAVDSFDDQWLALRTRVATGEASADKSSMWRRFIADFDPRNLNADSDELFASNRYRGYGFVSTRKPRPATALRQLGLHAAYAAVRAMGAARQGLWNLCLLGMGDASLSMVPSTDRRLKELGAYDEYVAFCRSFEFTVHNGNSAKLFYVAKKLEAFTGDHSGVNVLEIGGGMGNLAAMLIQRLRVNSYAIVDLPEMLLHSSLVLRRLFPSRKSRFVLDSRPPADPNGDVFIPADAASLLRDDSIDIAVIGVSP